MKAKNQKLRSSKTTASYWQKVFAGLPPARGIHFATGEKSYSRVLEACMARLQATMTASTCCPPWPMPNPATKSPAFAPAEAIRPTLAWKNGKVIQFEIRSKNPGQLKVMVNGTTQTVNTVRN